MTYTATYYILLNGQGRVERASTSKKRDELINKGYQVITLATGTNILISLRQPVWETWQQELDRIKAELYRKDLARAGGDRLQMLKNLSKPIRITHGKTGGGMSKVAKQIIPKTKKVKL